MENLKYDKNLSIMVGSEKIKYGILFGNEKIVFIKAGAPRDIDEDEEKQKTEYIDKYLLIAHRVHARIGATVICASNCDLDGKIQLKPDTALIKKIIKDRSLDDYELYFVGNSDGGDHSLRLSQQFSQTVKFLGINSSYTTMDDFVQRITSLSNVKKIFVYGSEDIDFDCVVPRLRTLECDNLEIIVLVGIDHEFTDRIDDFISLIDLI
jgi:hypothetical protein